MSKKISTSMRLSEEAVDLLKKLAGKFNISQASIMEIAIRKMAEEEGIPYGDRISGTPAHTDTESSTG